MQVMPLDRLDMRLEPGAWDYTESRRAEVDAFFAAQLQKNPSLWNGRILVLARHHLADGVLTGRYREADFASLLWWLRHDCPGEGKADERVCNAFSMAALRAADGAFLLGRMASWTRQCRAHLFRRRHARSQRSAARWDGGSCRQRPEGARRGDRADA